MFFGALASIIHGAALPAFTIIFGDFINIFIDQAITEALAGFLNNGTVNCSDPNPFPDLQGMTFSSITAGVFDGNCSYVFSNTSTFNTVINSCFSTQNSCLSNDLFIDQVNIFVYVFIGIAVGVFTLGYLEVFLFLLATERQVKKIRLAFYRAIIRQEIGWFDANPSGELATRIAE